MRIELAEKLLVKIMEWSAEEVSVERPLLQALANFKFDEYQQFSPGIRFIESLAQWLNQFETIEDRKIAYDFVKTHLIFISNNQISQLVNLSFSTLIKPILVDKVASISRINKFHVKKIIESVTYKNMTRQSLFVSLSDGSRIDQLRRFAQLSNEQVLTSYFIDEEKIKELISELVKDNNSETFSTIFLIDDFTASGTSYARIEDSHIIKGKLIKFLRKIYVTESDGNASILSTLFDLNSLSVHIIFYIATEEAILSIKDIITRFKQDNSLDIHFTVDAVQIIDNNVKESIVSDTKLIGVISQSKYFDETIVDKHYQISGKNEMPYLGFNECALPLVLNHNTPNNSLPIIWFSEDKKIKGLFPRITRHKE